MKAKILSTALFVILFSVFFLNNNSYSQDKLPAFNVKVLQHMSTNPAAGVTVIYKLNGVTVHTGITDTDGKVYWTANSGTYDIYVFYPAPPNDGQSGTSLGFFHNGPDLVTISLGPWY